MVDALAWPSPWCQRWTVAIMDEGGLAEQVVAAWKKMGAGEVGGREG